MEFYIQLSQWTVCALVPSTWYILAVSISG